LDRTGKRSDLLDRADADAIRFPQRAINCPRLCDSHFSATNEGRNIQGIGIAVAGEALTLERFEHCGLEDPPGIARITRFQDWLGMNPKTMPSLSKLQKASVVNVPSETDVYDLAVDYGQPRCLQELP
jgi:hypothetical protein